MLTKVKKGKSVVTASIALLFLILFLNFNRANLEIFLFDTLESVNSLDPGYSSLKEFLGLNNLVSLGNTNTEIIVGLSKHFLTTGLPKIPSILFSKISGNEIRPKIEDINFDINFKNFQTILEDRQQGLQDGILINPRTVNARLTYSGKTYKARIRLKGDLPDHWRSNLRMSFRVTLKGDETILGMRRFSVHSPGSRQYPHEQVYQGIMKDMKGLSVPHKLLNVSVNGINWGVMNVEEHMSKELLEKQESRESIIFKFSDEQLWQYQKKNLNPYYHYKLSDPQLYSSIYQSRKYLGDRIYREQYSHIVNLYAKKEIHKALSVEPALKAIILSGIWDNQHALNFVNSKFYLNPYTLKLDTITTDQGPIKTMDKPYGFVQNLEGFYIDFLLKTALEEDVKSITKDLLSKKKKLYDLYSFHESYFPFDEPFDRNIIDSNFEKIENENLNVLLDNLRSQIPIEDNQIIPPSTEQLASMPAHVKIQHYDNGEVWISNLLPIPVNLESISLRSDEIMTKNRVLPASVHSIETTVFETPFKNLQDEQIQVLTNVRGIKKQAVNGSSLISNTYNPLDNISNLEKYPFVTQFKDSFTIRPGTWIISEPLIILGNLKVEQGTKLIFKKDSYLIVKGSLQSLGTEKSEVKFTAESDTWKGLYVLGDGSSSIITHTEFSSTSELRDGILQLTGGVTFYNSNLSISDSSFLKAEGEDALNIVKSEFSIDNITINKTFSDGLDFDFSSGSMKNSTFLNVGGDAVDVSGGFVNLSNILIKDIRDKGISAGEGSNVSIDSSNIYRIGVGIASKDGSEVQVKSTSIEESKLYDLMTYSKKSFFNKPKLSFNNVGEEKFSYARQKDTYLMINNSLVADRDLDVEELYKNSVMSK